MRCVLRCILHDVRVPLNSVVLGLGNATDILDEPASGAPPGYVSFAASDVTLLRSTLVQMSQGTMGMAMLLNNYLSFAKVEAGVFTVEPVSASIADVLHITGKMLSTDLASKQLHFTCRNDGPATACLDPARVRECLTNYLSNAIKFSSSGGRIELACRVVYYSPSISMDGGESPLGEQDAASASPPVERGTAVIGQGSAFSPHPAPGLEPALYFSVVDDGSGISVADQAKLFHPFQQIAAGAQQRGGGSGLGLNIVRTYATFMRGVAGVKSVLGSGSEFYLCFPLQGDTPAAPPPPTANSHASIGSEPADAAALTPVHTACVVDDVDANKTFLQRLLQRRGGVGVVHTARDGVETVELAEKLAADSRLHEVQVWLVDEEMPRMNGSEAVRRLRSMGVSAAIFSVTGYAMDEDRTALLAAGVDGVITKPVLPVPLKAALATRGLTLVERGAAAPQ